MAAQRSNRSKRAERRASKEREAAFTSPNGSYKRPDRDRCEERPMYFHGWQSDTLSYVVLTWRQAGRIVDFQITMNAYDQGNWRTFIEIDCKHGHVHYHVTPKDEPRGEGQHLYKLDTVGDVAKGFGEAIAFVNQVLQDMEQGGEQ